MKSRKRRPGSWLVDFRDEEGTVAWLYVDAHTGIPNCFHIFADDIAYIGEPGVEPIYN